MKTKPVGEIRCADCEGTAQLRPSQWDNNRFFLYCKTEGKYKKAISKIVALNDPTFRWLKGQEVIA